MNYTEFLQSKIDIAGAAPQIFDLSRGGRPIGRLGIPSGDSNLADSGFELDPGYFLDGCGYLQAADAQANAPTLFDFLREESSHDRPAV